MLAGMCIWELRPVVHEVPSSVVYGRHEDVPLQVDFAPVLLGFVPAPEPPPPLTPSPRWNVTDEELQTVLDLLSSSGPLTGNQAVARLALDENTVKDCIKSLKNMGRIKSFGTGPHKAQLWGVLA